MKLATVVVVPAVNKSVCETVLVLLRVLNVFAPVNVRVETPVVPPILRLL